MKVQCNNNRCWYSLGEGYTCTLDTIKVSMTGVCKSKDEGIKKFDITTLPRGYSFHLTQGALWEGCDEGVISIDKKGKKTIKNKLGIFSLESRSDEVFEMYLVLET